MTQVSCDVVITTRNRPDALARCLGGLGQQSIGTFGVIVVDDCSDTPLAPVVERAAPPGLDVTVITLDKPSGPAAGRNAGVAASDADFIVFIDDDVLPNPEFVDVHLTAVSQDHDPDAPIVSCGPFVQPADWKPTPWNLWEARQMKREEDRLTSGDLPLTWRNFHTGNNCVPRATFNEVGGFDVEFKRAEDDELGVRLHRAGCQFRWEPGAIAWHYAYRTLDAWRAIPRAYACYDVAIDRRYPAEGYLADKKAELGERRLPLRVARRVFSGPRRGRLGVAAAVRAARVLYQLRIIEPAMWALSVAYDLSYVQSMKDSEAAS